VRLPIWIVARFCPADTRSATATKTSRTATGDRDAGRVNRDEPSVARVG
jgi:hypothetical protein